MLLLVQMVDSFDDAIVALERAQSKQAALFVGASRCSLVLPAD